MHIIMNSYETALLSNNIKMNQTENCTELVAYIESVDLFMQFYYLTYVYKYSQNYQCYSLKFQVHKNTLHFKATPARIE